LKNVGGSEAFTLAIASPTRDNPTHSTTLQNHSKGAARSLIRSISRESLDRGYNGRIIVDVAGSAEFYKKMGFVETGERSVNIPEMVLTSEAAKKLIEENV
jgi:predicted N-acetyltransferase YhbS